MSTGALDVHACAGYISLHMLMQAISHDTFRTQLKVFLAWAELLKALKVMRLCMPSCIVHDIGLHRVQAIAWEGVCMSQASGVERRFHRKANRRVEEFKRRAEVFEICFHPWRK